MSEFRAAERLIYLSEFSDEVMPCAPRLDAWAEWLNAPVDATWVNGPARQIADGEVFEASTLDIHAEPLVATYQGGSPAWLHPEPPEGADFFAEATGGGHWDGETINDSLASALDCAAEMLDPAPGDEVEFVVGRDAGPVRVRFTRNPDGTATCAVVDPSEEH